MKIILLAIFSAILSVAGYVYGEGGKKNNPHLGDDVCLVGNTEACDEVPAPPQSGIRVYICDGVEIVCVDEPEDDEEDKPKR